MYTDYNDLIRPSSSIKVLYMVTKSDITGKLTDLTIDKKEGDATALSFKVINTDGINVSVPAAAQLLPWDLLSTISALSGEEIGFEHTRLYEVVNVPSGRILMRSAPASGADNDNKIEAVYVPHEKPVSPEAEMATLRYLPNKLNELGIIDYPDTMQFLNTLRTELGVNNGAAMGK